MSLDGNSQPCESHNLDGEQMLVFQSGENTMDNSTQHNFLSSHASSDLANMNLEGNEERCHTKTFSNEECKGMPILSNELHSSSSNGHNFENCQSYTSPSEGPSNLATHLPSEMTSCYSNMNVLNKDECNDVDPYLVPPNIKFPYLKKGEGTSRYKMRPLKGFRKNQKLSSRLPQKKLTVKNLKIRSKLPHNANCKKLQERKLDCLNAKERFEALEQLVERASFCSTSSEVENLLKESDSSACPSPISSQNHLRRHIHLNFDSNEHSQRSSENVPPVSLLDREVLEKHHHYPINLKHQEKENHTEQTNLAVTCPLDLKLIKSDVSEDKSSTPSKVQFSEQGVEVLEYSQLETEASNTSGDFNESDLVSISDLEELAALTHGISPIAQGSLFATLLKRAEKNRFTENNSSVITNSNKRENNAHHQGQESNVKLPDDFTSKAKFTQAVKVSHISKLAKDPSCSDSQNGSGLSSTSKSKPVQRSGNVDLEAHKLLLLSKVNELNKEINFFKEKTKSLEKESAQQELLSKDFGALQIKFSKMESEKNSSLFEIKKLKAQNSSLKTENVALRDENKILKRENHTLKNESLAFKEEILSLKCKINNLEEKERKNLFSSEENKENLQQSCEKCLDRQSSQNKMPLAKEGHKARMKMPLGRSVSNTELTMKNKGGSKAVVIKQSSVPAVSNSAAPKELDSGISIKSKNHPMHKADKSSLKSKSSVKTKSLKKVHFYSSLDNPEHFTQVDSESLDPIGSNPINNPLDSCASIKTFINKDYNFMENLNYQDFSSSNSDEFDNSNLPDKIESFDEDGIKEITYPNGNKKKLFPNGMIVYHYHNGDKKTIDHDKTIYIYAKDNITHEIFPDEKEIIHFPDGQCETYFKDGSHQIIFPDHSSKTVYKDGKEICVSSNGAKTTTYKEGHKIVEFPNGQKEIYHNNEIKRIFPDGTVKILYPDGLQETRYSSGVVRIKDKKGNVVIRCEPDLKS